MSVELIFIILLGGIIALLGTVAGTCLGTIIKNPTNKTLSVALGFSSGLMLSVVMFDLIPEATHSIEFIVVFSFIILGMLAMFFVDVSIGKGNALKDKSMKVALLASIGLMLHNIPEGIIMGSSFLIAKSFGLKLCFILTLHDIPEGLAVAAPLLAAKLKPAKVITYGVITAMPTAFGVWLGMYLGTVSEQLIAICLSIASGVMLYITCGELIPEAIQLNEGMTGPAGLITGIICGLLIINLF